MAFDDLDSFQERTIISLVELMSSGRYHSEMTVRYVPQISDSLAYSPDRWELELASEDANRPYSLDLYGSDNLNKLLSCGYLEMKDDGERRTAKLSPKAFQQYGYFKDVPDANTPKCEVIRFWLNRLRPIENQLSKGEYDRAEQSFFRWSARASKSISELLDIQDGENLAQIDAGNHLTSISSTVAIKERCDPSPHNSESLRKAFEQEARLLANLHHHALPNVKDHFFEDSHQFIVMDFVEGEDLKEELSRRGSPFCETEVICLASDLLEVLAYLHSQKPPIIHHDIKPSNIKMRSGKPILLDFGFSRGVAGQMSTLIDGEYPQHVRGHTPAYASPEQVRHMETDERSDLYSLGATLHHLAVGHPARSAQERLHAMSNNLADPFKPVTDENPSVGHSFSEILKKAMAIDGSNRFQSASDMALAIRSMSNDNGHLAVAREVDERLAFQERRREWQTSNEGLDAAQSEFRRLCDAMRTGSKKRNDEMKKGSIAINYQEYGANWCVASAKQIILVIVWHCRYDDTALEDAFLSVEFYRQKTNLTVGIPTYQAEDRLSTTEYSIDLEPSSTLVWRRRDADQKMNTQTLVDFYLTDLIHRIARSELSSPTGNAAK